MPRLRVCPRVNNRPIAARRLPGGASTPQHPSSAVCAKTAARCDNRRPAVDEPDVLGYGRGMPDPNVCAIDLFCGVGGLSHGLQEAGVSVVAGIDIDPSCRYPFETNIDAAFLGLDIRNVTAAHLDRLWPEGSVRVLAGCAPCQPFSPHRRGKDTSEDDDWSLLREFQRLILQTLPEIVTMENVPRAGSTEIFREFVAAIEAAGYTVSWGSRRGVDYGLPQSRRRLVLLASLLGPIELPAGHLQGRSPRTVRDAIKDLPAIKSGEADPHDPLHTSRTLSPVNMQRIRASSPGGTWEDWPEELRAPCHRRKSGATFRNVYARMEWDKPAPTITTLAHNFGTGRFGHPEQDRPISLREAALLQGFPRRYAFVRDGERVSFDRIGRLIGNAVPPPLGRAVGVAIVDHVAPASCTRSSSGFGRNGGNA
jgi:DNA (cytosine-5)-methyltransferase 1